MKKFKENCPCCGKANNITIWDDSYSHNEFYLCHCCGYYFGNVFFNKNVKEDEDVDPPLDDWTFEGVTFDPRIIPLKKQLNAIRKNRDKYTGLMIGDCRKYKPPKYKKTKPDEQN